MLVFLIKWALYLTPVAVILCIYNWDKVEASLRKQAELELTAEFGTTDVSVESVRLRFGPKGCVVCEIINSRVGEDCEFKELPSTHVHECAHAVPTRAHIIDVTPEPHANFQHSTRSNATPFSTPSPVRAAWQHTPRPSLGVGAGFPPLPSSRGCGSVLRVGLVRVTAAGVLAFLSLPGPRKLPGGLVAGFTTRDFDSIEVSSTQLTPRVSETSPRFEHM
jgi:hypothetical protein